VLQPRGRLDQTSSPTLQLILEQSLHQATEAVILDLIWVEAIDSVGLEVLKSGVRLAHRLSKALSFHAVSAPTRAALDLEKATLRALSLGKWAEVWQHEFEQFLNRRTIERFAVVSQSSATAVRGSRSLRDSSPSQATASVITANVALECSTEPVHSTEISVALAYSKIGM